MGRRDPRAARTLGLWTASWLAALLLAGLLWVGEVSVQWPVLLVPALWALFAVRPRGRDAAGGRDAARRRDAARPRVWEVLPGPGRTDTVERPYVRERPDPRREY